MKATLFALFVALLMVGCGEADLSDPDVVEDATADAVDWSKLQDRDGVTYLPNTQEPFSGYAKQVYENEQIEVLAKFKDGYVVRVKQWQENGTPRWDFGFTEGNRGIEGIPWKEEGETIYQRPKDGPETFWHENGQKKSEGNYKDGVIHGPAIGWHKNGQKAYEANYIKGKENGLSTEWYENGQIKLKIQFKDGKALSADAWKPNGEKCPVTNLKGGNGVVVIYNDDGTEDSRDTYKDGLFDL
jgi:antitoxin component YwqK of YwqJK toxin-antitoxin module